MRMFPFWNTSSWISCLLFREMLVKMLEWCLCKYKIFIFQKWMWIEIFDVYDFHFWDIPSTEDIIFLFASDSDKRLLCFHSSKQYCHTLCLCSIFPKWWNDLYIILCRFCRKKWEESETTLLSVHSEREVPLITRTKYHTSTTSHRRTTITHTSASRSFLFEHLFRRPSNFTTMLCMCYGDTTVCLLKDEKAMNKSKIRSHAKVRCFKVDCTCIFSEIIEERSFHKSRF